MKKLLFISACLLMAGGTFAQSAEASTKEAKANCAKAKTSCCAKAKAKSCSKDAKASASADAEAPAAKTTITATDPKRSAAKSEKSTETAL